MSTTGIILAAGLSRRMGTTNKLLAPWHGKPLLRHIIEAAMESALDDIIIVTGHDADAIENAAGSHMFVRAEQYARGMGASLAAGANALLAGHSFMVLLSDMPLVTASHINEMLAAFDKANPLVATTDEGAWGHPVLLPARLREAVAALDGDQGARTILQHEDVSTLPIGEAARRDFDTPDAFN